VSGDRDSREPDVADHEWHVESREHERHEARRRRRHAFERLDPARTALVVVDVVPFFGDEVAERYARSGGEGLPRNRLDSSLAVHQEDVVAEKLFRSAWFPGSSDLPAVLAARAVDTLLVTGTVTNVCVEHTVRDASTCGLRVVLVADACAATRDRDHNATLHVVYRSYGDVRPTEEVLDLVAAGGRQVSSS
jgi:nicotinamidase-related amidase